MLPIHTILHGTDFSENSDFAFRMACALARDYQARLIVLHVVPPPVAGYAEGMLIPEPIETEDAVREKLEKRQPHDPNLVVEYRLADGDPATEIVFTAEDAHCDVIVIGTHGRTGLARLLMGSIAEQVVRRASCPVVTIKKPLREAEPVHENTPAAAARA